VYDKKVTDLRKQWAADYKQEQELAKEKKRYNPMLNCLAIQFFVSHLSRDCTQARN
jgi:hypothetical protein